MNLKALIRGGRRGPQVNGRGARRREQTKVEGVFLLQKQLRAPRDDAGAVIEAVPPLVVRNEKFYVLTAKAIKDFWLTHHALSPEMSAKSLRERVVSRVRSGTVDFIPERQPASGAHREEWPRHLSTQP
jgi:hypothetical protein